MDAVTRDEILAEFEALLAASDDPEGYVTAWELADMMNLGKVAIQKRLRVAQQAGRLSVVRVQRPSIDGRMMVVPAYRILPG